MLESEEFQGFRLGIVTEAEANFCYQFMLDGLRLRLETFPVEWVCEKLNLVVQFSQSRIACSVSSKFLLVAVSDRSIDYAVMEQYVDSSVWWKLELWWLP
jgi:hypothetical protein